jgi:hypothetical protein
MLVFILRSKNLDTAVSVAQLVSLLSLAPLVVSVVVWARRRPAAVRLSVERAADELAEQLRLLWEPAAAERAAVASWPGAGASRAVP